MPDLRIFIVEDDSLALLNLERLLDELGFALAGHAAEAETALKAIEKEEPGLVLMDINIKGSMNGIELAEKLTEKGIPVVFLTALDDSRAYEAARRASPYGYLVKPVSKFTLQSTLESALLRSQQPGVSAEVFRMWQENEAINDILFIRSADKYIRVNTSDICLIEADGNYSIIHTASRKFAVKVPLKEMKLRLSSRLFVQIHRSYIVQLTKVESISTSESELAVNGQSLPIGGSFRAQLIDRLNKI